MDTVGKRRRHPLFARFYARVSPSMERGPGADLRRRMLAGISGRVVEIGAGNGLNFAHYPPEVTGVTAVEPEPYLRQIARQNANRAPVPVEVVDGTAERLLAADATYDAAVASLVLCSVPDQAAALHELYRVVRPGGRLHFLEHVVADTPGLRCAQHLVDATVWPVLLGGCHTTRDTVAAIAAAGFTIERLDRFRFPDGGLPMPAAPHVLGVAVRPADRAVA